MICQYDMIMQLQQVAPNTNLLECARRADGGAAIIVADKTFMEEVTIGSVSFFSFFVCDY